MNNTKITPVLVKIPPTPVPQPTPPNPTPKPIAPSSPLKELLYFMSRIIGRFGLFYRLGICLRLALGSSFRIPPSCNRCSNKPRLMEVLQLIKPMPSQTFNSRKPFIVRSRQPFAHITIDTRAHHLITGYITRVSYLLQLN